MIYDDTARSAARVRLELILERLHEMGIEARGEVMDPEPYLAVQDAMREWGADEIIISTYMYPRSGLLRRDLVERIEKWSGLPVEHVVVDLREEPVRNVLVLASQTVGGRSLIETLERRSTSSPHRFTVILPPTGPDDETAQERLDNTLAELRRAGLDVTGYVAEPDPFNSVLNALGHHPADEIVVSTLPDQQVALAARRPDRQAAQGDCAAGRARRVRSRGRAPGAGGGRVVESASVAAGAHVHEHHGPPEAHKSSRIDSQLLGILLFIISEAMLFGSFFTAYFFVRVVQNEPWPPEPFEFPVLVASMNTAILVSSSFTVHYALHSIKKGNRLGHAGRAGDHLPARLRCSCSRRSTST